MAINLNTFADGDTDYVTKLNENVSDIEEALNPALTQLEALVATTSPGGNQDFRLLSFNMVINGTFDYWQRGTTSRPDAWILENVGSGFSVEQNTDPDNIKINTFSAKITGKGQLTQVLEPELLKNLDSGQQITASMWCKTETNENIKIGINNGVGTQFSDQNTGSGDFEKLDIVFTIPQSNPSEIKIVIDNDSDESFVSGVVLIRGNPSGGAVVISNDPTLEKIRVLSLLEKSTNELSGVGYKNGNNREFGQTITFCAPKRDIPLVTFDEENLETGFDIEARNISECGFDLFLIDIGGETSTDGINKEISWTAEVLGT